MAVAQAMKLSVLIGADPSGLKAGGAESVSVLGTIKTAANDAGRSIQALIDAQLGLGRAAASTALRADDIQAYGAQLDALRAKYNPVYAAIRQFRTEAAEIREANRLGAISFDEMTAAIDRQRRATLASIATIKGRNTALKEAPGQSGGAANQNFQASNLAFQLQDVFTTAPFMPWYTVALQQGPQAAAAISSMEKPAQGLLAAFTSMVNPVSLITIGLIGAGAAAVQYFTKATTDARTLDDVLQDHKETLEGIKAVYGQLGDATSRFSLGGKTFVDASMRTDLAGLSKEVQKEQRSVLEQMAPNTGFGKLAALSGDQTKFTDSVSDFLVQIQRGNPDLETFNKNIDKTLDSLIQGNADNPEALQSTAEALKVIAADAVAVKGEFEAFSAPINKFKSDVAAGRDGFGEFQRSVAEIGKAKGIEEQGAKLITFGKTLLDINAKLVEIRTRMREAFDDRGPAGLLLSQGRTNQQDAGNQALYESQQRVALARSQKAFEAQQQQAAARTVAERVAAARAVAASQYPDDEDIPRRRQRIELAGLAAQQNAERDLKRAQEDRVRTSQTALDQAQYELTLTGKSVAERNRLIAAYQAEAQIREAAARAGVAADEKEIANARAKAAAIVDANAQVQAGQLLQQQGYQIEQLQLEARLIGATADERARATAQLQAEQQLRQQGIDLLSREGQQYIANAQAMAKARQEIDRQNQAYQNLQQTGSDVIDQLTSGTSSLKDVGDTILKTVKEMAVTNPLKNQLLGTNLPTIGDLFAGKSASALAGTSTATMTVSARTVVVNGSTVGSTLGANNNQPNAANQNGVRPDVVNGQIVNNPSGGTDIEAYIRQAALKRGIDPDTAVAVARSEGGLKSWNLQSQYFKNGVQEESFGPFQMNINGGLGANLLRRGIDPRLAANGPASTDYALDYASKNGWGSWYGADKAGISNWQGIGVNQATDSLQKFSNTATSATGNLGTFGTGLGNFGQTLSSALSGTGSGTGTGGGLLSALLSGLGSLFGFAGGGYTGDGDRYQVAGRAHRGEVIWNQDDVARWGGPASVEAMRRGVAPMPRVAYGGSNYIAAPSQQASVTNVFQNMSSGAQIEHKSSGDDGRGGRQEIYEISDRIGQAVGMKGGGAAQALAQNYGVKRRGIAR